MRIGTVAPPAAGSSIAPTVGSPPGPSASSGESGAVAKAAVAKAAVVQTLTQTSASANSGAAQSNGQAIRNAARQINDFLKSASAGVEFTVDENSKRVVVRIVDSETKQVIRQIPSEEMLAISQSLDRVAGMLFEQKA